MYYTIISVVIIFMNSSSSHSAKILGIFTLKSTSHHSLNQPIMKSLASRGHDVTIVSYLQSNLTVQNYTEVLLGEELHSYVDMLSVEFSKYFVGFAHMRNIEMLEIQGCTDVMESNYIQVLINSTEKPIDLLFAEAYHSRCYHLLAHKLDVPLILLTPASVLTGVDYFIGNPNNPSWLPLVFHSFTTEMTFIERVVNSIQYARFYWFHVNAFNAHTKVIANEYLRMDIPPDDVLNRRVALSFNNNHFSFISKPESPNSIDIAGVHIQKARKLSQDIEDFIEESAHGVILFSFGTIIKATTMSQEKLQMIKEVFSLIPQRVLWRVDDLNITGLPPNVKLGKWFPQRDILEHENVLAFISHGGIFSTLEAIHTATPVIGIPFMFDQFQNIKILVNKGAGISVDYHTMDKNILLKAITKITLDKSYRHNIRKLSKIFRDRPRSQMDEAIYWSEYVLKYQGAPHLRTHGADMPLYQYLLLDVLVFILVVTICHMYLSYHFLKYVQLFIFRLKEKNKIL